MKLVRNSQTTALALILGLALAGCEGTSTEQQTGAGVGAGLGAAIGGGIGLLAGDDADERLKYGLIGAGIGAAVGGAAGYAVGTHFTNERTNYAQAEQYYDAQIADAQSFNGELRQVTSSMQTQVSQNEQQIAQLAYQRNASADQLQQNQQFLAKVQEDERVAESNLQAAQVNLNALASVRQEAINEQGANSARYAQLNQENIQAQQEVAKLTQLTERSRTNTRNLTAQVRAGGVGTF